MLTVLVVLLILSIGFNAFQYYANMELALDFKTATEASTDHNLRANRAEGEVDRCRETIVQLRQRVEHLDERAEFAETTVKGQNATIAQLWAGNDRLLTMVSDMRRLGFEMPKPESWEPPENIGSVEDDDREALKRDPKLVATDD